MENIIIGSGTVNTVAKFVAENQIADSIISENESGDTLILTPGGSDSVYIRSQTDGDGSINLEISASDATGPNEGGGALTLNGGQSADGPGGSIYLLAGTGGFDSGDVNLNAGSAGIDGSGGDINLTGGTGTGNPLNTGGSINFFPGPGPTGEGVVRSFGRFVVAQFTTLQILAIVGPDEGSVVYDTDEHTMKYFNGTSWVAF